MMKKFIPVIVAIFVFFGSFALPVFAVEAQSTPGYEGDGVSVEDADTAEGDLDYDVAAYGNAIPEDENAADAAVPANDAELFFGSEEEAIIGGADEPEAVLLTSAEEEDGLTEKLAKWFNDNLSGKIGGALTAFIVSLFPILECRGGMIVAKLCDINLLKAFVLCYIGNMIPVPFILLFIKEIFKFMKKHNILKGFIEKLEGKSEKNREKILRYKQWGLLVFVAVPLPGTGGWTGSLFASLLNIDFKKALPIIAIGVFIADLIMAILTYGAGALFNF